MATHGTDRRAIGAGLALAAMAAALIGCSDGKKAAPHVHRNEAKETMFQAALDAPVGKTDCETVLNAYKAMDEAAAGANIPPPWERFPPDAEFLARCNALPPEGQSCLLPRNHGDGRKCGAILEALDKSPEGKRFYALIRPE